MELSLIISITAFIAAIAGFATWLHSNFVSNRLCYERHKAIDAEISFYRKELSDSLVSLKDLISTVSSQLSSIEQRITRLEEHVYKGDTRG